MATAMEVFKLLKRNGVIRDKQQPSMPVFPEMQQELEMAQCDSLLSTSGVHSETESPFSSGEEEYDSDNDPVFIPSTDIDSSDSDTVTDTGSKHGKADHYVTDKGSKHDKTVHVTDTGSQHPKAVYVTDTGSKHGKAVQMTDTGSKHGKVAHKTDTGSQHPKAAYVIDTGSKHGILVHVTNTGSQHGKADHVTDTGFNHSESESLLSSDEEYNSDKDPVFFIPPTDIDSSDSDTVTDTGSKHGKAVHVTDTGSQHGKFLHVTDTGSNRGKAVHVTDTGAKQGKAVHATDSDTGSKHSKADHVTDKGFNHSESESLFSSDEDYIVTDIGSRPTIFVPETEVSGSEESGESVTFPALTQKRDLESTLPAHSTPKPESSITVQSTTSKKCWYCVFCGKPQKRLPRHLVTQHADEESVIEMASCRDGTKKNALLTKLRNVGNHLHNVKVLRTGEGVMIVAHRPTKCEDDSHDSYVPCPDCYGYFRKTLLYRHACLIESGGEKVRGAKVKKGQCLLLNQKQNSKFSEFQYSFRNDFVSVVGKTDVLIRKYGNAEFEKNGHDKDMHNYIRSKVRTVAKVLLDVRKVIGRPVSLTDCISPDKYDALVETTKRLAGFIENTQEFAKPSLARNIGMYIKKCALIHQSACLQNMDSVGEQKALQLIKLIELNWNQQISHHALRTLRKRKMNVPCLLPVTSDVVLLSSHLHEKAKTCTDALIQSDTQSADKLVENWTKLNSVTLTQIIMFNRRRQGEVSKMKVTQFTEHSRTQSHDEIEQSAFSPLEQKLARKLTRIEIPGKKGRTVPILLTSAVKASLETLVQTRDKAGINPDNTFLFARQTGHGHVRGSDCLRDEVEEVGVSHPQAITSTKLRKQIATISQVVNLRDHEMDVLADFMGHDIRIHREFYRLPQQMYQAAKISKLLLALEKGNISTISGKTLDEITVSADDVLDEEDGDEEESVPCKEPAALSTSQQPDKKGAAVCAFGGGRDFDEQAGCSSSSFRVHPKRTAVCAVRSESDPDEQPGRSSAFRIDPKRRAVCSFGGDSSDSDACTSSSALHARPKRRKMGKVRRWSTAEKTAASHHFAKFILNGKLPGKADIEAVQSQSPALQTRSWSQIKDHIRNKLKSFT